jgi:hypothetical protein
MYRGGHQFIFEPYGRRHVKERTWCKKSLLHGKAVCGTGPALRGCFTVIGKRSEICAKPRDQLSGALGKVDLLEQLVKCRGLTIPDRNHSRAHPTW